MTENKENELVAKYIAEMKEQLGDAVGEAAPALDGILTVEVKSVVAIEAVRFMHDHVEGYFDLMTDLTAVDWLNYPESGDRFELVYLLCSTRKNHRVRIKTRVSEGSPQIKSATSIYKTANWLEREVYDLFGIRFSGHPDLRRIMLWEDFEGHPLRKDFPTRGYHPVERTPET